MNANGGSTQVLLLYLIVTFTVHSIIITLLHWYDTASLVRYIVIVLSVSMHFTVNPFSVYRRRAILRALGTCVHPLAGQEYP